MVSISGRPATQKASVVNIAYILERKGIKDKRTPRDDGRLMTQKRTTIMLRSQDRNVGLWRDDCTAKRSSNTSSREMAA
jgi:hypothetical protein